VLSDGNRVPPHKQGLHDYQNPKNEQLTDGFEQVAMSEAEKSAGMPGYSETKENVDELAYNGSEHGASQVGSVKSKAGKKTFYRDNKHDAEKFEDNFEAFSLSLTNSLGVDNKGFDCYNKHLPTCSPYHVTVAAVDKVKNNDAFSRSFEQNHNNAASETLTIEKPSIVSCDLESAFPAAQRVKTVRAWLNDLHLYKVIPLSSNNNIRSSSN